MIRKLLKVEFREAFSSMLPVGAGMLVLSALTALNSAITARIRVSSAGFDWLGALLAFATAVCFISADSFTDFSLSAAFIACSARRATFSSPCPRR